MGRGKLVFKGEKKGVNSSSHPKKKKKRNDVFASKDNSTTSIRMGSHEKPENSSQEQSQYQQKQLSSVPMIQKGKGKITSSNTVVTGYSTQFSSQFRSGDALVVQVPPRGNEEMRVVTMVLSDSSCAISSAFSSNLVHPNEYSFIVAPRNAAEEDAKKRKLQEEEAKEIQRTVYGTYGAGLKGNLLVYRKKTETGSYVIQKEALDREVTRGDLLDMRTKKKSDRYC